MKRDPCWMSAVIVFLVMGCLGVTQAFASIVLPPDMVMIKDNFGILLANPDVLYLLLILGFYALLFEFTHPNIGLSGLVGIVLLILAYLGMKTLPINPLGVGLIFLAVVLFVVEAFVVGFGILAFGGVVAMILGSLWLFKTSTPVVKVSETLVYPLALTTAAITIFLMRSAIRAHRAKVLSGQEGMVGLKGEAFSDIAPGKRGKVSAQGAIWIAVSDEEIKKGEDITVVAAQGMELKVKKFVKGE